MIIEKVDIRLEVVKAITQLKDYKAPGEDGIYPKMFEIEVHGLVFYLKNFSCEVWVTGIVPSGWKK